MMAGEKLTRFYELAPVANKVHLAHEHAIRGNEHPSALNNPVNLHPRSELWVFN